MSGTHDSERGNALLARARGGDREALAQLFERYRERLLARVRLMLGEGGRRRAESLDYMQGLFLAIAEAIEGSDLEDERSFLRWATGIARNDIRDESRRRRERALESFSRSLSGLAPAGASGDSPPAQAERGDELERLFEALEQLRPAEREVIELRDLEGLSYRAIAARTEYPSEGAAQVSHARAVARLSRLLG